MDIDSLNVDIKKGTVEGTYLFSYQGKNYLFKRHKEKEKKYNELIAEKIAQRMGLPCAHYFLGKYQKEEVVISEMFDMKNYHSMRSILQEENPNYQDQDDNNLSSIWIAFLNRFDQETTERLMDQLVKIFLFDALIDNRDRHDENYGLIITEEDVSFAPLFDHDAMFDEWSSYFHHFSMGIEKDDLKNHLINSNTKTEEMLEKFLWVSDDKYRDDLKEYLKWIRPDSIQEILEELKQEGVKISKEEEELIHMMFSDNVRRIEAILEEIGKKNEHAR